VGIPKVLNIWSIAPFLRTYLEAVGIERQNVVFSEDTSEEMWAEGGKYGSIDPCFPSKVGQAHIHQLLVHEHARKPLNALWLPAITHVPSPLVNTMDHASCPIVQGVSDVMKAAFTKEKDWFAERQVAFVGNPMAFTEPNLMQDQLYQAWGAVLGITRDESDFAANEAWRALDDFQAERERRGREILEACEREDRIALLMIGRPYHSDPGLNHEVLQEFQALGYPIVSMNAIPRDRAWLERFFRADLDSGLKDIFDINDVWPENYSANSAFKVWCARFAARHPNVAVLDLSSFKCGHDAPIYATIDQILQSTKTPFSALHEIDANKPGGSLGIRVRTYAYTLERQRERLEDLAAKKRDLTARIEQKRAELLARRAAEQAQLHAKVQPVVVDPPTPRVQPTVQSAQRTDQPAQRKGPFVTLQRLAQKFLANQEV
jgi:predicted nucleotide-binding protein (sugar kinase/HSP70/actin superfamily)